MYVEEETLIEDAMLKAQQIRTRLMDFMRRFENQHNQIELLQEEGDGMEGKLAEVSPQLINREDFSWVMEYEPSADAVTQFHEQWKNSLTSLTSENRKSQIEIVNSVQNELEQVRRILSKLESIFQTEQHNPSNHIKKNVILEESFPKKMENTTADNVKTNSALIENVQSETSYCSNSYVLVDAGDYRAVIPVSLKFLVKDNEVMTMELSTADTTQGQKFHVKEGTQYTLRLDFFVQREGVEGLRYIHKVRRHGLYIMKIIHTLGNYRANVKIQSFTMAPETAPQGYV
ncbi:hypothetical protein DICVIV_09002 [Dictyocaulus viviparus]|uniref:Uncharacterized protein n=1 Tax=Dictyocaulus viviparus TaxID=29172 RepID=A0A0D8XK52_DICVI|nr:hypothetical protein DICVIV_09002 [Dictyocaulus viviparus]